MFASLNQLRFLGTSRRDDLISLCYLLVFLLNGGELPGMQIYNQPKNYETFRIIRAAKFKHSIADLCNDKLGTSDLEDFLRECFSLQFTDTPKYNCLRAILNGLIELEEYDSDSEKSVGELKRNLPEVNQDEC